MRDISKLLPAQVKPEPARIGVIRGTASNRGILVGEMNIVEFGLSVGNMKVGIELFDCLSIRRSVRCMNVPLNLRVRPRS